MRECVVCALTHIAALGKTAMTNDVNITFGDPIALTIDGERIEARRGQTIAAALVASGRRIFRHTRNAGRPRGLYCAMGMCFDCIVKVDGRTERACVTKVEQGMQVTLPRAFAKAGAKS